MEMDLYARVYLDCERDVATVAKMVAGFVGGLVAGPAIVTELAEIFVFENEKTGAGGDDAFRHYRYVLEIEPLESVDVATYRGMVAELVAELRDAGFKAAAAGDFEDERL